LKEIGGKILNYVNFGTPYRLKRVKGTEQMIVGCDRHIAILEFDGREMNQIASVQNVHDHEITDFVMRGFHLYTTAFNEPLVKVTRFGNVGNVGVLFNEAALRNPPSKTITETRVKSPVPQRALRDRTVSPYSNFRTKQNPHPALTGLEKIVASPDGTKIYTGGKGLHVFQPTATGLIPIDIDANKGKLTLSTINLTPYLDTEFFGLKVNPSNKDVIIHEPSSNDLVALNSSLGFIDKKAGA
jgi:hypothetical protein